MKKKNIIITTHRNPDADAFGSSLSLYIALQNICDNVSVILPTSYSSILSFFPRVSETICFPHNKKKSIQLINKADIIYLMDYNSPNQLREMASFIENSNAKKILIDHHRNPIISFDEDYSDVKACSASILSYSYIKNILKQPITKEIAYCIYAGIISDTGAFSNAAVTQNTHKVVSELMKTGIETTEIYEKLFSNFTLDRMKYFIECISENIEYFPKYKAMIMTVSRKIMEKYNYEIGYNEGFVNWGLRMKDCNISVFIGENNDGTSKLSFRSRKNIAINTFAQKYFNGGGHKNAAGGETKKSAIETKKELVELLCKIEQ